MSQQLKAMGVVGAGGAGFPTYVKAASQVEFCIANGAECEPLVHKDVELMKAFPSEVVSGLKQMMAFTGSRSGKFGIKTKNKRAIASITPHLESAGIDLVPLGDFYPAGDEYELVYLATQRLIPAGGIPLHVGCAVNNVETLYNVDRAMRGLPVMDKFVSVSGAVRQPSAFWVPIGTPLRECLARAGGASVDDGAIFIGGIMMGRLCFDLADEVTTKTTAALIVLPREHLMVRRRGTTPQSQRRIGKSGCDQCSYCTELCPRYLLGYEVMPHRVMRSLGFNQNGAALWNPWAQLCCSCGLCSLYSCPEDLFPREACDQAKMDMRAAGQKFEQKATVRTNRMKEERRVPTAVLRKRLHIEEYEGDTPYDPEPFAPDQVRILLGQHVGKPARPIVGEGDRVERGMTIAQCAPEDLGVDLHASITGFVETVTDRFVTIRADHGARRHR